MTDLLSEGASRPRAVDFSTLSSEVASDPYPLYEELRGLGRVLWMPAFGGSVQPAPAPDKDLPGFYILTRYDDCTTLLRHEHVSADPMRSQLFGVLMKTMLGEDSPAVRLLKNLLLFMDPPDHTRLRSLANAAFSRKAVEGLRSRIASIVDELLAEAKKDGGMDLVADFAYPLPVTVIAEMLGVPMADRELFGRWSRELVDLFGTEEISTESTQRGNAAIEAMNEYFTELGHQRRRHPQDDLLTAFVEVEEEGERLSHDEYLATCLILLIAGHETTANLIGLGTLALLHRPEALERLRDEPGLIPAATDELLRFDSPVQFTARTTTAPLEVAGQEIPGRERVMVLLASANRDPDRFEDPGELVLDRSPNPHLSFGGGIHFCLGAPLARLEAREAFAELVKLPLELASGELEWRRTFPIRGLRTLPVSL